MVGAVKAVGFSWDGSFVVGGSDEGNGLEIVCSLISFFSFLPVPNASILLGGGGSYGRDGADKDLFEHIGTCGNG